MIKDHNIPFSISHVLSARGQYQPLTDIGHRDDNTYDMTDAMLLSDLINYSLSSEKTNQYYQNPMLCH